MKLWLIKCGKVIAAIRRDGFIRGTHKAAHGLWAMMRMVIVPPGDILIITSGIGDSARYRAHHVAEELRFRGFRVSVTVQDHPFLQIYANRFRVFVFHRTLFLGSVARLFAAAKAAQRTIVFETDDLVYDPSFLVHMDFYRQMQPLERLQYADGVGGEILRDPIVRVATTTTTFLAEKLREHVPTVFVVPNKLSAQDLSWTEPLYAKKMASPLPDSDALVTIGYFSGVLSHNKDFATITAALCALCDRYPRLRIHIYGPLDLDPMLQPYADRFVQKPYVPRMQHFANVAQVDINIAPLEIGNPFCEAKSELKFFEAGIVGVPTVAAATQTFQEAITNGVTGFVAYDTKTWIEALSRLIEDPALRRTIGMQAYAYAHAHYTTTEAQATAYDAFLRTAITQKD